MAPSFDPIEAKMRAAGLSDAAVSAFKLNFDALAGGESGMVRKKKKMMMEDEDDDGRRIDGGKVSFVTSPSALLCPLSHPVPIHLLLELQADHVGSRLDASSER